jgi:hypothetical protein
MDDIAKPPFWKKPETARWLAHTMVWGTISTTSVHLNGTAWGQPISFVDGTFANSTGQLYFYATEMDYSIEVSGSLFYVYMDKILYIYDTKVNESMKLGYFGESSGLFFPIIGTTRNLYR